MEQYIKEEITNKFKNMKLYGTKYGQSWCFETVQKIEKWMRRDQEKRITEKAQLSNNQHKMVIITIDALDTKRTF